MNFDDFSFGTHLLKCFDCFVKSPFANSKFVRPIGWAIAKITG